jgi:hypothetical protein
VKLQNGGFSNGSVTKHIYKLYLHKKTNIILKMTITKDFLTFYFSFFSKSSREARSFYDTLLNYTLLFSSIKTYTVHVGVGSMGFRNQADCLGTNDCMVPLIHSMEITNWNAGPCQAPHPPPKSPGGMFETKELAIEKIVHGGKALVGSYPLSPLFCTG